MKILVIAPTPFFADRGTHIRILEEALALERRGNQITIATYHIGKDISGDVDTHIDVRRIRRLLFWYKKLEAGPDWQKILLDIMLVRKAFNLARTQKPDIIHGHLHEGVLIGWIVKKCLFWRTMKLVGDFHGSLTKEMESHSYLNGGILKSIFKRVEKFVDNLGDAAITSSLENTEEIKKMRKGGDVETALDGVNLSYYQPLSSREQLKKELELPENKTIVTYTGAMVGNKGIQYLLDAIPQVLEKTKDVYFMIAGFPVEGVEQFVKNNKLEEHVRIVSPLDYFFLPKLLCASDLGVDPKDSQVRQASGKILQYMAAGLPVVCFDRPNNREYLADGGVYVAEISAGALAEKMVECIENKDVMRQKGEYNKTRAQQFSWDKPAEQIEKIYQKI
jgi:glycosyltransferase involved in cell wall biosynthesis